MTDKIELLNVNVKDIEFLDRARKDYKDLNGLLQSFKEKGIIQPVALVKQRGTGKPFKLLAGGRRFSAAVLGEFLSIPARVYPANLTELDRREIELMENVEREDLEWKEKVWLTEEVHRLQVSKKGEAHGSSPGHSARDTAELIGKSKSEVSRDRQLAAALEEYPDEMAVAKNETEALRTLKRIKRRSEDAEAAKKYDVELARNGIVRIRNQLGNAYIVGDFFERVVSAPDGAAALVEIDPPYGMDLKSIKKTSDPLASYNEIPVEEYDEFLNKLFHECYRVMSTYSWMVCWYATQWYQNILDNMRDAGLEPCHIPGIWNKDTVGQTHQPELRLGSSYEPFIYARKGQPKIRQPGRSNVFTFRPVSADLKGHPTERPVELIEEIIRTFACGNHMMVPFLGSGNTLLAASNCNMTGFGYDLGQEYKNAYLARVQNGEPRKYKSYT